MIRILISESTGQAEAGIIELKDGKLSFEANVGYEGVMDSVKELTCSNGQTIENPSKWYECLPQSLTGMYVRAEEISQEELNERDEKNDGEED